MNTDSITTIMGCLSAAGLAAAPLLKDAYPKISLAWLVIGTVSMAIWGKLTNKAGK